MLPPSVRSAQAPISLVAVALKLAVSDGEEATIATARLIPTPTAVALVANVAGRVTGLLRPVLRYAQVVSSTRIPTLTMSAETGPPHGASPGQLRLKMRSEP